MNYLDLFSGGGGFHQGLVQAGFKFDWCGHSEVDKYAEQVYHKHFPESRCLGDVRTINPDELPKINLITFGFPCQDLSVAGKRGGLHASRSGLFFEAMRIVESAKPDIFIFENVKGLLSSSEGRDFEVVLRTIADLGLYDCEWQLVNTRWVLPQNRERIFFIGHARNKSRPKVFPIGESDAINDKSRQGEEGKGRACVKVKRQPLKFLDRNQKNIEGDYAFTVDSVNSGGVKISEATKQGYAVAEEGDSINLSVPNSKTRRGRVGKGEAQRLDTGMQQYTIQSGIRRLTPVECERLQGFKDGWTDIVSDTQRYKIMGNAVTVDIVEMIGRVVGQFEIS